MDHTSYKPRFEFIYGLYIIPPGYKGVVRRLGKIVDVVDPGRRWGVPFIHDIALVPETPGIISGLEQEVRSSDKRKVTVVSDTTITIDDPIHFIKKAPEQYLGEMVPKIQHAVQQTIGGRYTAKEVVEENDGLADLVKQQLNTALNALEWGLLVKLFRYTASTDPADIISGAAVKLRQAELADAAARRNVSLVEADTRARVDYIQKRYKIDADVYALRQEGETIAHLQRQVGSAQIDVLTQRLTAWGGYITTIVDTISGVRDKLEKDDAELMIAFLLAPLGKMLGEGVDAASGVEDIRGSLIERLNLRIKGQGLRGYTEEIAATGVNPNVALAAEIIPRVVREFKK